MTVFHSVVEMDECQPFGKTFLETEAVLLNRPLELPLKLFVENTKMA